MVPLWAPVPLGSERPIGAAPGEAGAAPGDGAAPSENAVSQGLTPTPPGATAPAARFSGTRRSLGAFAGSGTKRDLQRSLGHYVRTGYGGAGTALRRFGGTAATAAGLAAALGGAAAGRLEASGVRLDPALLVGRSAEEVMDAVVEAVRPIDGTQDAEASRAAIRDALSDLLTRYPEADLLNLGADERGFAVERFAASDVFRRFELDVGKVIVEKAPSALAALSRLKEAREYINEAIAASFRKLTAAGRQLTAGNIGQMVRDALAETLAVFEGYAE